MISKRHRQTLDNWLAKMEGDYPSEKFTGFIIPETTRFKLICLLDKWTTLYDINEAAITYSGIGYSSKPNFHRDVI